MTRNGRRAPSRISAGVAVGAAGLAGVTGLGGTGSWVLLAPIGAILVMAGLWRQNRRTMAIGCSALICATLVTGLTGGHPARLTTAVAATLVAWDLGEHALSVGEQLGREATTWRLEFLHVAATVVVATGGIGVVYLLFVLASGGQPILAVVFLLIGAVALLATLRQQ